VTVIKENGRIGNSMGKEHSFTEKGNGKVKRMLENGRMIYNMGRERGLYQMDQNGSVR